MCTGIAEEGDDDPGTWAPASLEMAFAEYWDENYKSKTWDSSKKFVGHDSSELVPFGTWIERSALLKSLSIHGRWYWLSYDGEQTLQEFQQIWENRSKSKHADDPGSFYWSISSHCNSPWKAEKEPYIALEYGKMLPSEMLLFYGNGLAVLSRAHTHHDHPGRKIGVVPFDHERPAPGQKRAPISAHYMYDAVFDLALEEERMFGETWRSIFELELRARAKITR